MSASSAKALNWTRPILMAIVGAGGERSAGEAIRGGADLVQVRAKGLAGADLVSLVRGVIAEVGEPKRVIVNSRADIAALLDCRGVHLPESGLGVDEVRLAFPSLVIGVSRHDRAGVARADRERVDYALVGPVFATPGKTALGLTGFSEMIRGLQVPAIAVGGIDSEGAAVLSAGARGVAAIRPFQGAQARAAAIRFRASLKYPSEAD